MADWYCSSVAYTAIAAFIASHAYSIGDIVKPTAPALRAQMAFRCTTAGTSGTEPAWASTAPSNNNTVTTGGATFTNVTGQSTYGWGAAAGDVPTLLGYTGSQRFVAGDRVFVSSDHSETQTTGTSYGSGNGSAGFGVAQVLSVNRAGSVPPVAADLTAGASCAVSSGALTLDTAFLVYHYGITYSTTGTGSITLGSLGSKTCYLDTCQLFLNTATTTVRITNGNAATLVLYNSTLRFGNAAQAVTAGSGFEIIWMNTPTAIAGATIPTTLFIGSASYTLLVTVRGVDLSAVTGTLVQNASPGSKFLFDSCRIASGVTRLNLTSVASTRDVVEVVNCYDGTNIINETYQVAGAVTTERTITLSGGATDDVGTFSHKLVSGTNIDKYVNPLVGFWMDVENTAVGSSKTATVEIISTGTAATWNPADASGVFLTGGNLIVTPSAAGGVRSVFSVLGTGKYYWEWTWNATGNSSAEGIANSSAILSSVAATGTNAAFCTNAGTIAIAGVAQGGGLGAFSAGVPCCIAFDVGAQLIWFRNGAAGNWNGSGTANPATGVGGYSTSVVGATSTPLYAISCITGGGSAASTTNFGASGFTGTPPAGFSAPTGSSGLIGLNNDDISLLLEYQGTTGSSVASFISSLPATVLTTSSAVTASSATWNSLPATPVTQRLQVTFTPRLAGRVRGQVRLGKVSTTVYVNPVIAIT